MIYGENFLCSKSLVRASIDQKTIDQYHESAVKDIPEALFAKSCVQSNLQKLQEE